jgi:hypothetical protein
MSITLPIPKGYKPSDLILCNSPPDNQLILEYGVRLLLDHKKLINTQITDTKYRELNEKINGQYQTINILEKKIKTEKDKTSHIISKIKLEQECQNEDIQNRMSSEHLHELNKTKKQYESIIDSLRNDITQLQTNQARTIQELVNESNEQLKKNYLDKIEELKNEKSDLKKEIQDIHSQHRQDLLSSETRVREASEKAMTDIKLRYENEKDLRGWISDKFESVISYHNTSMNNTIKGGSGENAVKSMLEEYYTGAIITDISKGGHQGDILFQNDDMKCLIEVKRKQSIKKEDVDKFYNDIRDNLNSVNTALFISMDCTCIPRKGDLYLEIVNKIPVLFIYLRNPYYTKISIEILKFALSKITNVLNKNITSKEFENDISEIFSNAYKTIDRSKNKIHSVIGTIKKQLISLEKIEKGLEERLSSLDEFCNTYNIIVDTSDELHEKIKSVFTNEEIKKLEDWTRENKKIPLKKEINSILNLNTYKSRNRNVGDIQKELKKFL